MEAAARGLARGVKVENVRLIARLDIKGPNLIKGVHLEGLRVVGDPQAFARRYYEQGADELIYMDIVASLYGRSNLMEIVRRTAHYLFVPLTVGGGVRSVDDVRDLLRAGADKVAINTAAVRRPELIGEISRRFGSQCMVLSIEAKRCGPGKWEVYTDCGREKSGVDVIEWARRGVALGAGEVLVTSIDQEGTRKGFDVELTRAISSAVTVPVIASGGYGAPEHLEAAVKGGGADAVAFADSLHYDRATFADLRGIADRAAITVRHP
jgi:imidazole glycerol-phosphate synthase subunit HisF